MSWGIFRVYDWIKSLKTPKWLVDIFDRLVKDVIYPALKELGEDAKNLLAHLIIEASKKDWSNQDKFNYVRDEFLERWNGNTIKDHMLNIGIEVLVGLLKSQGII
jgi:hypothetical protein